MLKTMQEEDVALCVRRQTQQTRDDNVVYLNTIRREEEKKSHVLIS